MFLISFESLTAFSQSQTLSTLASLDLHSIEMQKRGSFRHLIVIPQSVPFVTSNLLLVIDHIGVAAPDLREQQGESYVRGRKIQYP